MGGAGEDPSQLMGLKTICPASPLGMGGASPLWPWWQQKAGRAVPLPVAKAGQ